MNKPKYTYFVCDPQKPYSNDPKDQKFCNVQVFESEAEAFFYFRERRNKFANDKFIRGVDPLFCHYWEYDDSDSDQRKKDLEHVMKIFNDAKANDAQRFISECLTDEVIEKIIYPKLRERLINDGFIQRNLLLEHREMYDQETFKEYKK